MSSVIASDRTRRGERLLAGARDGLTLLGPVLVVYLAVYLAALSGGFGSVQARYALVNLVIVVGLQLFVGNSGVLSFGHIAFVGVGAWTVGLLTIDPVLKRNLLPDLFQVLAQAHLGTPVALLTAALAGAVLAALVGPVLLRLNGLQAGIASFAVLLVVNQVLTYWTKISPPSGQSMVGVPDDLSLQSVLLLALASIAVSWLYQRTRSARMLRASRENLIAAPASGINVTLHRVIAFVVSGALCGLGGGLWAETNRVLQASQLSVGMTFTIVAMLVLGGQLSIWGGVIGTVVYSVLDAVLQQLQTGVVLGSVTVHIPAGSRPIALGALLVVMLLFRPDGITRGREFGLPRRRPDRSPVPPVPGSAGRAGDEAEGTPS